MINHLQEVIDKSEALAKKCRELEEKCRMHDFFWEGNGFKKRGFKNCIQVANYIDEMEEKIREDGAKIESLLKQNRELCQAIHSMFSKEEVEQLVEKSKRPEIETAEESVKTLITEILEKLKEFKEENYSAEDMITVGKNWLNGMLAGLTFSERSREYFRENTKSEVDYRQKCGDLPLMSDSTENRHSIKVHLPD